MRFRLALRELEQVERALHVDLMGARGRELRSRREQRRQMEYLIDFVFGEQPFEQRRDRESIPTTSRCTTRRASASSGTTSSVTTARAPIAASRSIRPWPISPEAPVTSTTGLRI